MAEDIYENSDYIKDLITDDKSENEELNQSIGERIKTHRNQLGLTLEEFSKATQIDQEQLEKIEETNLLPQLNMIGKITSALSVSFQELVSGVGTKPFAITHQANQKSILRNTSSLPESHSYIYKSLAPNVKGHQMEPLIVQLRANPDGSMSKHEGEEFIYVLEGTVILKIDKEVHELNKGDSVYYLSTTLHQLSAKKETATILAVVYSK
ncbi:MAG: helix-turn-helix transcriptional regulator [Deltaproteobacteria bacterium]|jgi:quercetin dioxygenase-like cupin family protein/DNA-binding XRE family transcriptional regulator|nr:helix-turn-helix transcriptional regulator [Deltaproteobacteria bacterium]